MDDPLNPPTDDGIEHQAVSFTRQMDHDGSGRPLRWVARCSCGDVYRGVDEVTAIDMLMGHASEIGYLAGKAYVATEIDRLLSQHGSA